MDLGNLDEVLEFQFNGKKHTLNFPSYAEQVAYEKAVTRLGQDENFDSEKLGELARKYFVERGMDEESAGKLPARHIRKITESLHNAKKN